MKSHYNAIIITSFLKNLFNISKAISTYLLIEYNLKYSQSWEQYPIIVNIFVVIVNLWALADELKTKQFVN